jgi:hypothetical protein
MNPLAWAVIIAFFYYAFFVLGSAAQKEMGERLLKEQRYVEYIKVIALPNLLWVLVMFAILFASNRHFK